MAGVKITDLPVITGANTASTDVIPIVDVSADVTSKITRDEFFKNIQGNVGIGTSSPSTKLDVSEAGTLTARVINTASTAVAGFDATNATGTALFGVDATGVVTYTGTAIPIRFSTSATERMRIDASGNVGIGVTPSAWRNSAAADLALQVRGAALVGYGNYAADLTLNAYLDATSTWKYIASGEQAFRFSFLNDGSFAWFNAPNGTAGNPITFTQAMTLDASGNLGIGTTSPTSNLAVRGVASDTWSGVADGLALNGLSTAAGVSTITTYLDNSAIRIGAGVTQKTGILIGGQSYSGAEGNSITFRVGNAERMRIDASGNVGVGTTTPAVRLHAVTGATGVYFSRVNDTGNGINSALYFGNLTSPAGNFIGSSGFLSFGVGAVGTAAAAQPECMRIDASGNLGLGVVPSAWSWGGRVIDGTDNMAVSSGGSSLYVLANAFWNGTAWTYKTASQATRYEHNAGSHRWFTAPSGTAGSAITWTQAMTLHASGGLSIGNTTDPGAGNLTVNGSLAYTRGNIVGTVSQSSGTPTGAIIEKGSNANGEYVRFADGTQICTFTVSTSASAAVTKTLPAAFVNTAYIAVGSLMGSSGSTDNTVKFSAAATGTVGVVVTSNGALLASTASCIAIGRWF